jgi:hypothetical protein
MFARHMAHVGEKRNKNWDLMVKPKGMGPFS